MTTSARTRSIRTTASSKRTRTGGCRGHTRRATTRATPTALMPRPTTTNGTTLWLTGREAPRAPRAAADPAASTGRAAPARRVAGSTSRVQYTAPHSQTGRGWRCPPTRRARAARPLDAAAPPTARHAPQPSRPSPEGRPTGRGRPSHQGCRSPARSRPASYRPSGPATGVRPAAFSTNWLPPVPMSTPITRVRRRSRSSIWTPWTSATAEAEERAGLNEGSDLDHVDEEPSAPANRRGRGGRT